jgi:GWxTD domain-containing protein
MQRYGLILFFMLSAMGALRAGPGLIFHYCNFGPDNAAYTELYFRLPGQTLHYMADENGGYRFSSLLQYRILLNKKTIFADKVWIRGPLLADTKHASRDLLTQVRVQLQPGTYRIEIEVADGYDSTGFSFLPAEISVEPFPMKMSGIELLDTAFASSNTRSSFYRDGFEVMPLVLHNVQSRLQFYTEFYGMADKKSLLTEYYLEGGSYKFPTLVKTRKLQPSGRIRLLDGLDVSTLGPGDYLLRVNIYDEENTLLSSGTVPFVRLLTLPLPGGNTATALEMFDALPARYYVALAPYLQPIASETELSGLESAMSANDSPAIKDWYYNFWSVKNKEKPYAAWQQYLDLITREEALFGSVNRKGYQTDRGRIFLRFGEPNGMSASHDEQEAYPYEIWQYHQAGNQRNVKFVFYDPSDVGKDYVLLYSDLRGLANNAKWKKIIYSRTDTSRPEEDKVPKHYGNELEDRLRE